jgi:hypothetical protein
MSLLNYNKNLFSSNKKRKMKTRRKVIEVHSPLLYREDSCFTSYDKKWLILKQVNEDHYIVRWDDPKKQSCSTQLVSIEDIQFKKVRIIDYLKPPRR